MRKWLLSVIASFWVSAAAPAQVPADNVDAIARDYTVLALGVQQFAPELVPPARPPADLVQVAKTAKRDRAAIAAELGGIVDRIDRLAVPSDPLLAMRLRSLRAHAVSLRFQLRPPEASKPTVAEHVRLMFGFEPEFPPLSLYDDAITRLDRSMPGAGELSERIEAIKAAAIVPKEKVEPVIRAAVAECRKRVAGRLKLPEESIELRFLNDPLVPGQMQYLGGGRSLIQVSTAVPADVDRLLSLACHETYPGHHTNYAMMDEELVKKRGWPEITVGLADSPQFPVSDAISEYGTWLVFPVDERIAFQRDVLYPLAGLTMRNEAAWRALIQARSSVLGATSTIARDYLDKKIDADTAKKLLVRYRLQNRRSADQLVKMLDAYGPIVVPSDAGWYAIDRLMRGKTVAEQWSILQRIESEPMLLGDLADLR